MLVLTRRAGESVVIAGEIEVKILSIRKGVARLGIEAPARVRVLRHEVLTPEQVAQLEGTPDRAAMASPVENAPRFDDNED
ncbi:MAG: carbon storage regulator [Gemmataceae bacterium]|nr:carbon storage regulator [Gemmataceae bacterium]